MSDLPADTTPDVLPPRMDKTHFSVVPLSQADDDNAFWHAQTPLDRLAALERMRRIAYGNYAASTRLQRVLSVVSL